MRIRAALAALALCSLAQAPPALAAKDFARLERVEVEPYFGKLDRVRLFLTLVHIDGGLMSGYKPEELKLVVGDSPRKELPGIMPYQFTDDELQIVIVVDVSSSFAGALERLNEPLADFLKNFQKGFKVPPRLALFTYGEKVKANPLEDANRVSRRWAKVVPDDEMAPPRMVDAVGRAVRLLAAAKPQKPRSSVRRIVIVIGDGMDEAYNDVDDTAIREKLRKITRDANEGDVTIHTIGFTYNFTRAPLRTFGQLSKKTTGTFRLAIDLSAFSSTLSGLEAEIRRELVLTYFVPADAVSGKNVRVECKSAACGEGTLKSNTIKAPASRCAGVACSTAGSACIEDACVTMAYVGAGSGWFVWVIVVLLLGGGAVGGGYAYKKMKHKAMIEEHEEMEAQAVQQAADNTAAEQAAKAAADAAKAQHDAMVAMTRGAQMLMLGGPTQGQRVLIFHGFIVGRAPESNLVINDGVASSRHAQLLMDGAGNFTITDLGSTNGTYVNGVRMTYPMRLQNGMTIRIGQAEMRFLQG